MEIYYAEAIDVGNSPIIYYIDKNFREGKEAIFDLEIYMHEKDAIKLGINFYQKTDVKSMYGEDLVAVNVSSFANRRVFRYMFCDKKHGYIRGCLNAPVYNADVDIVKIWMHKNGHEPMDYLENPLFYDIEVQVENFMEKYNSKDIELKYQNRILVISWYDANGKGGVFMDDDESELLRKFYEKARQYSCIIGWNSTEFDFPYIVNRSKRLGLKLKWKMIPEFDLMRAYKKYAQGIKKYYEVISARLDDVAKKYLGEDKGKVHIQYDDIDRLYKEDRAYLAYYCLQDSKLLYDIYNVIPELKEILKIDVMLMKATKVLPYENSTTHYVTSVLDRMLYDKKIGIPAVGSWRYYGVQVKRAGGFVVDPITGLYRNVVAVDYRSLYPSIMITHNIGMNTMEEMPGDGDIRTEHLAFNTKDEGYLSEMMKVYMAKRLEYKKLRDKYEKGTKEYAVYDAYQLALKLLINGTNGALTKENLRYYNNLLYNSVVDTGHMYIKFLIEAAKEVGWKVYYGDTDSIYVQSPYKDLQETADNIDEINKILYDGVKKRAISYYNIPEDRYDMLPRAEKIMSQVYFLTKKMYFMHVGWMDGHFVDIYDPKGISVVRENTLPLKKMVLRHIFENYILTDKSGYEDEIIEYLLKLKQQLFNGERDDLITQSQRVKEIRNANSPYFVAAKKMLKVGKFLPGDVVEYIQLHDGYVYVPAIEKREISYLTYKKYWVDLGRWIDRILGYKVSGYPELGFKSTTKGRSLLEYMG